MRMLDETLAEATARRWRAVDPLLPRPGGATGGCGAELTAAGRDGRPVAVAACEHAEGVPGSLDMTWNAARTFRLTALVADGDVTRAAAARRLPPG